MPLHFVTNPVRWSTTLLFLLSASLITAALGILMAAGVFPPLQAEPSGETFFLLKNFPLQLWMGVALFLGILAPLLLLPWCWPGTSTSIRHMLLLYLLVHIIQIATELIFTQLIHMQSMTLIVGLLYTAYRIWQLQVFSRLSSSKSWPESAARIVFVIGLIFWTLNLGFLGITLLGRLL